MSSGNLVRSSHPEMFTWAEELDPAAYLFARYRISTVGEVEDAARGMAMEQSAATVRIPGYVSPESLRDWTIRVRRIEKAPASELEGIPPYALATEVYPDDEATGSAESWEVELAFPLRLLAGRPAQLLNVVVGELPRLGFLTRFRLLQADLPAACGPGPAFGAAGIRALLGNPKGPLLCRSMRPAVGLDREAMARLQRDVLLGGFHLVKDDELACFPDEAEFRAHLRAMLRARDEARDRSGEPKLYLANLICEPEELEARWNAAVGLGVDGVLVAPFVQGLGTLRRLAAEARLPILAHNTFSDLLTRHPSWGLGDAVLCGWLRRLGADWCVTPGPFAAPGMAAGAAAEFLRAAAGPVKGLRPLLPILQGGKHPQGLADYHAAVGSDDFMLIVASWVDGHPEGLSAGARIFREAVDA